MVTDLFKLNQSIFYTECQIATMDWKGLIVFVVDTQGTLTFKSLIFGQVIKSHNIHVIMTTHEVINKMNQKSNVTIMFFSLL